MKELYGGLLIEKFSYYPKEKGNINLLPFFLINNKHFIIRGMYFMHLG